MKHFQNIVIGFGKGGKTLSAYLGSKGESVAMIEKSDQMYGGTCINVGCIPSKSLVTSSLKLKGKDLNLDEKKKFYKEAILEKRSLVLLASDGVPAISAALLLAHTLAAPLTSRLRQNAFPSAPAAIP